MTRIGTPPPGIVPTSLPQGSPAAALLAQLPSTLSDVALGAFLTGTVLDRAPNGLTMLQTPNGVLGLKTTVPLPVGSTVTLQIQTAGAQLQAIVLSITPQAQGGGPAPTPIPPYGTPAPQPGIATPTASTSPPAASTAPQPPVPSTIVATVIGPSGGPVPAGSPQPTVATAPATAQNTAAAPTTAASQTAATVSTQPQSPAIAVPGPTAQSALGPMAQPAPGASPSNTATAAAAQTPPALTAQSGATSAETQRAATTALPAAAQAAYQRQLNAVPTPPSAIPQPAPATAAPVAVAQPAAPPPDSAGAKPLMPDAAPAPLPTGTQVQVRLLPTLGNQPVLLSQASEVHAEAAAATARQAVGAAAAQPNAVIMATVVARTPAGQVILDSALGRLLAPLPRDGEATAPGARLFLELIGGIERVLTPQRPAGAGSGLAALARNWSTLKEAMRQLQDAPAQQDASAALDRAVPKAGPRLAQQMLAYLETAQNGVKAWLGDTVARALGNAAGQKVMEQLERDLREMQHARHGAEGDWRMTLVPLLDGQELRQIRFFERRRKQEQAKRKKDESARFVVECEHSEHGAIQLDGLMHEKRLDLIVRSHEKLPAEMEQDILVLFGETCTGLDLTGQLFFQAVPAFPVNPLDEIASAPVRVSV